MHQERVLFLPAISSEGERMVKADLWHEIHSRFKLRESKKSIARTLGLSILTVRKILRQTGPQPYERQKSESAWASRSILGVETPLMNASWTSVARASSDLFLSVTKKGTYPPFRSFGMYR